jgi:GNAT superfamily N-acetyltransferase
MNLADMLAWLPSAEMAVAHFNALRTSAVEPQPGIQRHSTGDFETLVDPSRPRSSYYNRAVALRPQALTKASLRALPAGIVGLELGPGLLTPEVGAVLRAAGFEPAYPLCYLGTVPAADDTVYANVLRLQAHQRDEFLDLLQLSGVDFPPDRRASKQHHYCTEQFQAFVAKAADGAPCGWATLFMQGDTGFLGNAFTLPGHRRSGVHQAMLGARLQAAAQAGAAVVFTDVEHGSQSHLNCERAGFRTLTVTTIWERPVPPTPSLLDDANG